MLRSFRFPYLKRGCCCHSHCTVAFNTISHVSINIICPIVFFCLFVSFTRKFLPDHSNIQITNHLVNSHPKKATFFTGKFLQIGISFIVQAAMGRRGNILQIFSRLTYYLQIFNKHKLNSFYGSISVLSPEDTKMIRLSPPFKLLFNPSIMSIDCLRYHHQFAHCQITLVIIIRAHWVKI